MARKEREFTCKRCSAVYYGPLKDPKVPSRILTAGVKMQAAGSGMSVFAGGASKGGYAMQAARIENRRDAAKAARNHSCPNCGSASHTVRVVKIR